MHPGRAFSIYGTPSIISMCYSGGFVGAAEAAVEGQQSSAELEAIARTAQHRLERGIWTSPGAGDLRYFCFS